MPESDEGILSDLGDLFDMLKLSSIPLLIRSSKHASVFHHESFRCAEMQRWRHALSLQMAFFTQVLPTALQMPNVSGSILLQRIPRCLTVDWWC